MGQPLVSVIIPTHNAQPWIQDTIQSVLNQTYGSLEIIAIDDASTDRTRDLLRAYGPRIHLIENEKNRGVSGSRNRGIQAAAGDLIALLDHDDLWSPDKIAKQVALYQQDPSLGIVFSDCVCKTSQGKSWRYFEIYPPERGRVFQRLLRCDFIPCLTAVIPKKILLDVGLFREDLRIAEEFELFLRITRRFAVNYVDEPLATYRIHDTNFSRHKDIYYSEEIAVLSTYVKEASLEGFIAFFHVGLGVSWIKQGGWNLGFRTLLQGLFQALAHPARFASAFANVWRQRKRLKR